MSKEIIDISVPLGNRIPLWPGSAGARLSGIMRLGRGDEANVTRLDCDIHTGTHVEAPWHCLSKGRTLDRFSLNCFVGPARVVSFPNAGPIRAKDLVAADLPKDMRRLLIKTGNSRLWAKKDGVFRENYVSLARDAARWIARRRLDLVGIDYLSIQCFGDSKETHRILMRAGVMILEGIDLSGAKPGLYELVCLPLRLVGTEGAPARAVLRPLSANGAANRGARS